MDYTCALGSSRPSMIVAVTIALRSWAMDLVIFIDSPTPPEQRLAGRAKAAVDDVLLCLAVLRLAQSYCICALQHSYIHHHIDRNVRRTSDFKEWSHVLLSNCLAGRFWRLPFPSPQQGLTRRESSSSQRSNQSSDQNPECCTDHVGQPKHQRPLSRQVAVESHGARSIEHP